MNNNIGGVLSAIAPINCFYNYKIEADEKCFSTECMFNQDPVIKERIKKFGCRFYSNHPKVRKMVKEKRNGI